MGPLTLAVLCLAAYSVISTAVKFRNLLKSIRYHPGLRYLITPATSTLARLTPFPIPYITPSRFDAQNRKYEVFREVGCDIYSLVSIWPVRVSFHVADPDAIREILSARKGKFVKPIEMYQVLSFYGKNLVVSEGEEWKRFRKISYPGFSERNNRLVWEETQHVVLDLFENEWGPEKTVCPDDVLKITVSIALFVISSAGFGQRISWKNDGAHREGYEMSFKETMYEVSKGIMTKAVSPDWLLKLDLTTGMRKTRIAFEHLERYMRSMIEERRSAEDKDHQGDLMSGLLDASEESFGIYDKLTDMEVISNIFIFLIAGHETVAHTLCISLALLALYPDEQEKLYEQTKSVLAGRGIPSYDDISSYSYALAVFYETLRMFPAAGSFPKVAAEDAILHTTNAAGEKIPVVIPKGGDIIFHVPGLHYNPNYWDEPEAFKPARFLDPNWPRDAFFPFSGGARSCIGRRFAEVEAIVVLTLFTLRYKITVKDDPRYTGETFEERRARLLKMDVLLTLTPLDVPLAFTRRD